MIKKLLCIAFMLSGLCGYTVLSAKTVTVDGMVFTTDSKKKTATLTKLKNKNDSKWASQVSVPKTIKVDGTSYTVTVIGSGALDECPTKKVVLPSTITSIEALAFYNCSLTSINLPSGLKSIGGQAFQHSQIDKITIPASVTSIGNSAFSGSDISKVAFKERTENLTIGEAAFYGTTRLGAINLPEKTVKIGESCFYASNLVSASIPSTLKVIPSGTFKVCDKLTTVTIAKGAMVKISSESFHSCYALTNINIPEGVTTIGDQAFVGTNINALTIPSTVNSIGESAFYSSNIHSITFKPSATTLKIGDFAFTECINLQALALPEGLNSIGYKCFAATGIKSLSIPSTLATIPEDAFAGTIYLTSVSFARGCQHIGKAAFGNSGFKTVTLPQSLQTIGELAFGYSKIETINIPNNVTTIGAKAFYNCPGLVSVNIPASVTAIGAEAFNESPALMNVSTGNPTPPVLGNQCFDQYTYDKANLIVPTGSFDRYKVASGWKEFHLFRSSGVDTIGEGEAAALPCQVYDLNGHLVTTGTIDVIDLLPSGIYIIRQGNSTRKIMK